MFTCHVIDTIYNVAVILVLLITYYYLLQHSLCRGIDRQVQIECSFTANTCLYFYYDTKWGETIYCDVSTAPAEIRAPTRLPPCT